MKKAIQKYLFLITFAITSVTEKGVIYLFKVNSPFNLVVGIIIFCIITLLLLMYFGEKSYHHYIEAKDEIEYRKIKRLFTIMGIICVIIILFLMIIGTLSYFKLI